MPDFDLDVTKPQLYRPFRHGPNHVTMGIRKLDWNNWIEMDSNFMWFHDTKVSELEKDIDAHVQYVDNAVTRDACFEVLEDDRQLPVEVVQKVAKHKAPCVISACSNLFGSLVDLLDLPEDVLYFVIGLV